MSLFLYLRCFSRKPRLGRWYESVVQEMFPEYTEKINFVILEMKNKKESTIKRWGGLIYSKQRRKKLLDWRFWAGCWLTGILLKLAVTVDWVEKKWSKLKNSAKNLKKWASQDGSLWSQGLALILDLNLVLGLLPVMIQTGVIVIIEIMARKWLTTWYQWNKWFTVLAIRKWCGKIAVYGWSKIARWHNDRNGGTPERPSGDGVKKLKTTLFELWEMCFRDRPAAMVKQRVFFRFKK